MAFRRREFSVDSAKGKRLWRAPERGLQPASGVTSERDLEHFEALFNSNIEAVHAAAGPRS
jgi:hypothetical protein